FDHDHNSDVWVIPAAGGSLTKISDHEGPDRSPRWSPDGKKIAFLGSADEDEPAVIYLAPAEGGKSAPVAKDFDQVVGQMGWAEKGKAIYFDSGVKGETHIYRLDVANGSRKAVTTGPRNVHAASIHEESGKMVFLSNDFEHLDDVYVRDGGQEKQITHLNSELWGKLAMAKVERVPYKAADGWEIDGFLVKPVNFDPSKKYPLVVS